MNTAVLAFLSCYWLLYSGVYGQDANANVAPLGTINIPVQIAGTSFEVTFAPELQSPVTMAKKLCVEQAERIGVTEENLNICETNLSNYLQTEVDKWVADRVLQIPLVLNGTSVNIAFFPERDNAVTTSTQLCNQYSETLALTAETIESGCIKPIANFLQNSANEWLQEKTLQVPVTLDNTELEVTFMPERQTPRQVASQVCAQYKAATELSDELTTRCVGGVNEYLVNRVNRWAQSKLLTVQVPFANIGNVAVQIVPERETTAAVARRVCRQNSAELQLTEENFNENCASPLNDFLRNEVNKWVQARTLVVPITAKGEQVQVNILPERESARRVAQRFCLSQVEKLGLTNENFNADCVNPTTAILKDAVAQWDASRQQ